MEFLASKVLTDCRIACNELEKAETIENDSLIRLRWFTCLALLRAVGHVIDKVDKKNNLQYVNIFDEVFQKNKSDKIFKNFINKERNLILKEYQNTIIKVPSERLESNYLQLNDEGDCLDVGDGNNLKISEDRLIKRYFKKGEGFEKYQLLHEIVSEGIKWWSEYIDQIIRKIKNKKFA